MSRIPPTSAEACASLFSWFTGTTPRSDSSPAFTSALRPRAFADRSADIAGALEVSLFETSVLVHIVSRRARGLRLRRIRFRLAIYGKIDMAFPFNEQGQHPETRFSQLNTRPTDASIYAWAVPSR